MKINKILLWALVLGGLFGAHKAAAQEEVRITITQDPVEGQAQPGAGAAQEPQSEIASGRELEAASGGQAAPTGQRFHLEFGGEYVREDSSTEVAGADGNKKEWGGATLQGANFHIRGDYLNKDGATNSLGFRGGLLFSDPEYNTGVFASKMGAGIDFAHNPAGTRLTHVVSLDWVNRAFGGAAGANVGWMKDLASMFQLPEDADFLNLHQFSIAYNPCWVFCDGVITFKFAPKAGLGLSVAEGQEQTGLVRYKDLAFTGQIGGEVMLGVNLGRFVNLYTGIGLDYTRSLADICKYDVSAGGVVNGNAYGTDKKFQQERAAAFSDIAMRYFFGVRARF